MFDSPIYKVKGKVNGKQQEIFIDVTGSAPNFKVPGKQLESTFKTLLKGRKKENTKILDIGAAKLRNTVYLLKKKYAVHACEFEDLFQRMGQARDFLEKAETYKNFKKLIFPNEFLKNEQKFDVILLINVINIMPNPIERFVLLKRCRELLKENGILLWYTQHGAYDPKQAFGRLNDGLITGKGRKYHMFYRDFSKSEIFRILKSVGFSLDTKYTFSGSGSNQAYAFKPDGPILISIKKPGKHSLEKIERERSYTDEDEGQKYETKKPTTTSKLEEPNLLKQYKERLDKLKPGKPNARKYEDLIVEILKLLFEGDRLEKCKPQTVFDEGRSRVDITFRNERKKGFFKELQSGHRIASPIIIIECKNYTRSIKNPEFQQIADRLKPHRGMFGIIICRTVSDKQRLLRKQKDYLTGTSEPKFIIILEDNDINKLIKYRLTDDKKIDDFLMDKLDKII